MKIRDELAAFNPYKVPAESAKIKLNTNECPIRPPQGVLRAICKAAERMAFNRYPDPKLSDLRNAIADRFGISPDRVAIGNGSNEIVRHLFLAYGGSGRKVVVFPPSYQVYEVAAEVSGTQIVRVPRDEKFGLGADALARVRQIASTSAPGTTLYFLCNPNNPTGTLLLPDVVEELAEAVDGLLIIDEAYVEFAGQDMLDLMLRKPNVALLRTFSKAYGLAGLRIGYLLADPEVIRALEIVQLPYHVNGLSQLAAAEAMRRTAEYRPLRDEIISERDRILFELAALPGVEVFPSATNFLLFRTPLDAEALLDGLVEEDVLVRIYPGIPGFERLARVTVGTSNENTAFVGAIRKVIGKKVKSAPEATAPRP